MPWIKNIAKNRLYWLLQVSGWSMIIFIETVNYTFFILGEFNWEYVQQFVILSCSGLLVSHFYKKVFIKPRVFDRRLSTIWFKAVLDVILITFLLVLVVYIPFLVADPSLLQQKDIWIGIMGQFMNLSRYVIVWIIIYYLYHILKKNAEIAEQKLTYQNVAKSAELELLKTQLNPHFLFNALNSIKALVLIDQEKARDAIIKLSELLRFTLNYEKAPLIPLNEEINEVIKYLELEKIRFGKRLDVQVRMQEETLEMKVPPAMVLTLAENAIKHGITLLPDGGRVSIESKLIDKKLVLEVINDGTLHLNGNMGIGLKSLEKRLEALFHDQGDFEILPFGENKVKAKISIG
ncbi:sensor histidine kinase [Algoriphagus confluentis]|uniref:Histidine kinase n=1 Tax=Algoriphagus confluentis TaxID=1697556 RepID=A0ABQ6PHW4_9BACT|nr:histidine kinase [Algoriphagus confluentis]